MTKKKAFESIFRAGRVSVTECFCVGGADEPYTLPSAEAKERLRKWVWDATDPADNVTLEEITDETLAEWANGPLPNACLSWDVTLPGCHASAVILRPALGKFLHSGG